MADNSDEFLRKLLDLVHTELARHDVAAESEACVPPPLHPDATRFWEILAEEGLQVDKPAHQNSGHVQGMLTEDQILQIIRKVLELE